MGNISLSKKKLIGSDINDSEKQPIAIEDICMRHYLIVFTVCAMYVTLIQIKTVAGKQEAQDKSLNQRMIAN